MPRETMPATHDVIARQDIVCMAQEVLAAATRIVGDAHLALEDRHQLLYHQCGLPRTSTWRLAAYINMAARRIHPRDGSPHASMLSSNHLQLSAYIHIAIKSICSHRTHTVSPRLLPRVLYTLSQCLHIMLWSHVWVASCMHVCNDADDTSSLQWLFILFEFLQSGADGQCTVGERGLAAAAAA
jgi:hypothetical protein